MRLIWCSVFGMAYALPPNNLVHLIDDDEHARKLHGLDKELEASDWRTVDPGRGPVRGWGPGARRRAR